MAYELELEIVTPFCKTYGNTITSCVVPGALGQFQVLKDHASMISVVNIGQIKIEELNGKTVSLATSGGFCEVKNNQIQIIVESAEFLHEIDVARAENAKHRAEERLRDILKDIDIERAKFALARAINRLKIAQLN